MNSGGVIAAITSNDRELLVGQSWSSPPQVRQPVAGRNVRHLTASQDGTLLAAIVDGLALHVWRASDGLTKLTLPIAPPAEELTFSPDGSRLAVCITNGDVAIVDVEQRRVERRVKVTSSAVTAAFTPDHARLLCAGRNGMLHIYRTSDWRELATIAQPATADDNATGVAAAALSPDGTVLAVLRRDGKLRLWRAP